MPHVWIKYIALVLAFYVMAPAAQSAPLTLTLPVESVHLRPSDLPGYAVAQQKCGICHSADYIEYQPPGFNQQQWTGLARKMKDSYGAPLSDSDVSVIGEYLAATYSGAAPVAMKAALPASAAADTPVVDVKQLLDQNTCLACHAIDHKVLGPAYRDVAERYRGDAQAVAKLVEHIGKGGVGRWGEVPMPPFPNLKPEELKLLSDFVLKQ